MVLKGVVISVCLSIFLASSIHLNKADDYDGGSDEEAAPPPAANTCNGIFLSYVFGSREKEYPRVKNTTAQSWAFKSTATILNTGTTELKAWKMFIGFQHREILVSTDGAVLVGGDDLPASVGVNGTYLAGYPQTDLKTSIDTAGDLTQIQAKIDFKGTVFGIKPPGIPMPKTIRLENNGFKCPAPTRHRSSMYVCCVKDKKFKAKNITTKFYPRQDADLSISYDVIQAYQNNYFAQVTLENNNPLGRLDHWNLTWEWMRGEFIYSMKGAYTHLKDGSSCIYGPPSQYYADMDFSQVQNCQKKPVITDLPPDRAEDEKIGKIPFCCRNGSLLPKLMNATKSKAVFQLQVFKIPPDLNRTAIYPPASWRVVGRVNPDYKCGAPIRVDPTEFPDPSGLQAISPAIASWQVACNITRPKERNNRCCVSFSAYYNDSVIPCDTCACGCTDTEKCNPDARPLLLPPESLLVPFQNRTLKAVNWAKIKKFHVPKPLPCGDNCGVSVNWHINSNYRTGWTVRITLFNWGDIDFEDWFVAFQLKRASRGFERAYSFNGTMIPGLNHTIFMQGLPGLNYLIGEKNGTNPKKDPKVPGKQQTVVSFTKKNIPGLKITKGDGFPTKLYFNGEECDIPKYIPIAIGNRQRVNLVAVVSPLLLTILLWRNHLL